jgi:DNA repair protein RecN (Recombination protein N)
VIAFGDSAAAELERLDDQEGARERLRAREVADLAALETAASRLTEGRGETAARLTVAVNAELPALGLPPDAFAVDVTPGEIGPSGADSVAFTFAPNPGEPARPLARIASGGEASRLSLALEVVLATTDETPLLVFDEIDAGVGGRNAAAVGDRLKRLSAFHQVMCVTHLPQVAAFADVHLVVGKRVVGRRTTTEVRRLRADERGRELAAMLAGTDPGDEALAAAEALLRGAGGDS